MNGPYTILNDSAYIITDCLDMIGKYLFLAKKDVFYLARLQRRSAELKELVAETPELDCNLRIAATTAAQAADLATLYGHRKEAEKEWLEDAADILEVAKRALKRYEARN